MNRKLLFVLIIFTSVQQQLFAQDAVDMILHSGKIVTVDSSLPEAEAVAVRGDKIFAVGSNEEIRKLAGDNTKSINLEGKLLIPGFIEGHGHFVGLGESLMMLDLKTAKSWEEIVDQVEEATKTTPNGQWIIGRGWHQEKWDKPAEPNVEGYPVRDAIDKVTPNHPVLLTHASGHACFANGYAMQLAGINAETPEPNGGEILHDSEGNPTGVFRETAQGLVSRARARTERRLTDADRAKLMKRAIELAGLECVENGITSFQDAGSSLTVVDRLKKAAESGELKARLYVMIRDRNELLDSRMSKYRIVGHANNFFTVRAIKVSIDGALGSHGAWLLVPYEDLPSSVGLNTVSIESAKRTAQLCIENDFQYCVHAIGDRANREVLDIFEEQFEAAPTEQSRRWRVEHAQHLHPDDIPRFGELGVVASMQGIHCTSDAIFVLQRLGHRRAAEGAYVWQKLLKSGAVVTNGTDAPVEDIDPIASFYATVSRKLKDGSRFFDDQRMSREEALKSYTLDCAYAAFEEDLKGSITKGKLADMVVLSKDIMACEEDEILNAKVDLTIVGGEIVFTRDKKNDK